MNKKAPNPSPESLGLKRPEPPASLERKLSPSIRDFESAIPYSKHDQKKAIAFLVTCKSYLSDDEQAILRDLLPMDAPNESLELDLKSMMQEQMMAARALRNEYFTPTYSLRPGKDAKEAVGALKSAQQIMDSILKKQEKIDLHSKLMIMEQSLLAVAQELPKDLQTKFFERVERILGENHG